MAKQRHITRSTALILPGAVILSIVTACALTARLVPVTPFVNVPRNLADEKVFRLSMETILLNSPKPILLVGHVALLVLFPLDSSILLPPQLARPSIMAILPDSASLAQLNPLSRSLVTTLLGAGSLSTSGLLPIPLTHGLILVRRLVRRVLSSLLLAGQHVFLVLPPKPVTIMPLLAGNISRDTILPISLKGSNGINRRQNLQSLLNESTGLRLRKRVWTVWKQQLPGAPLPPEHSPLSLSRKLDPQWLHLARAKLQAVV